MSTTVQVSRSFARIVSAAVILLVAASGLVMASPAAADGDPTISGVSPIAVSTDGGATLTITGTGFTSGAQVFFSSQEVTPVTFVSATELTVTTPAWEQLSEWDRPPTLDVTVVTAGGTSATSKKDQFSYKFPPTVSGVTPAFGSSAGGNKVVLAGSGFNAKTVVMFGANAATSVTFHSVIELEVTVPAGVLGTVDVVVSGGNAVTSPLSADDHYTYGVAPAFTAEEPGTDATVGTAYTPYTFAASGSPAPTFTVIGTLPPGMSLTSAGVLSGTPTGAGGQYTYEVTAKNLLGTVEAGDSFRLNVNAPLVFTAASPPAAVVGVPYSYAYATSGYPTPYYLLTGTLPAGLTISRAGLISGTPTEAGVGTFTVTASNEHGKDAVTPSQSITAAVAIPLQPDAPTVNLGIAFATGDHSGDATNTATATGLSPGSGWELDVFSTPQVLGSGQVLANGTINFPFQVPANLPAGVHHLLLTATSAAGAPMTAVVWFTISASGKILAVSTTGPTPTLGQLAYTGGTVDVGSNVIVGLLAILIGGGLLARRRLRIVRTAQ